MIAYIISRVIGTVRLDLTHRENHESTMRVTDNPVESGAAVADHAVLEPRQLTIEGLMVDWLEEGVSVAPVASILPRVNSAFLNAIALPSPVQTFTNETMFQQAQFLGAAAAYPTVFAQMDLARPIAPWLPNFAPVDSLDMSSGSRRVEQCFDNLRMIQKSGDTVQIVTGSQSYDDMLLIALSMTQHWDGSASLSVTARELFIVETQTVSGITVKGGTSPTGTNKSGRAGAQSMNTRNKGNVQTPGAADSTKRSALNAMIKGGGTSTLGNLFGWGKQ